MCDYSLQAIASRPAKVGDKLTTTGFSGTTSRGFAAVGEPNVAVCVLPGTEIAFDDEITEQPMYSPTSTGHQHKVGRFRQINTDQTHAHHDALELPDGKFVLLTSLKSGQLATVLQLPAAPQTPEEAKEQERVAVVA